MAGVAATCGLVVLLVATTASLPNTLLEDTKQAALEAEPIASKGKHQSNQYTIDIEWETGEGSLWYF
jgi:hypothetical protein